MSTLIASNISDGTTSVGTGYVVNGSAKAWVYSGSDAFLFDSFNISSATDVATGDQSFSYTNSLVSNSYAAVSSPRTTSTASWTTVPTTNSTASLLYTRSHRSSTDVETDRSVQASVYGDLA